MINHFAVAVTDSQAATSAALAAMKDAEAMIHRYRVALEMIADIVNEDWAQGESAATLLRTCRGYALGALGAFDRGVSLTADGIR